MKKQDRDWYPWNQLPNVTHISYGNNGLSYGYDIVTGSYALIQGVDWKGIDNNLQILAFGVSFEEARKMFFNKKGSL